MEKVLKLYTYVNGVNDTPFPNEEQQVITSDFRSDYKRMGGVPTISCTIMHPRCLDKLWTDNVYATFNGEKFFIKQVPTSSYDNTDARYKHELELVSERIILDNVYVYDVVKSDTTNDKPVSNSSKFVFFGTIHEYAERLNRSLEYSGLDYRVVVDEGISSEGKMVSFENQFFSNAIQESYNIYEIPYYYVGKVIHIGFTDNAITKIFKYGQDESLLSIQKQNANYKIVNRVTGVGSADNIPYYYPNDYESKEEVEANGGTWMNPQTNLMPPIYRDTLGAERFYKALNNTYISPQTGTYYEFENPFIEGKPKEHIVNFEDIKPSIVCMVNSNGYRIDMFSDFAYDLNDNDETDEEGNYLHPYFFGKLRKFDGEFGFNLFDHAIDEDEMVISMTSGNCGACEFVIGVDEDTQKNIVQVDEYGNLLRDSNGNIRFGSPQDRQNDTSKYEVWIALKKDINTFGVIMPNATNNYKPSTSDTFVILHIDLPKAYILAAEDKLKEELIKYMAMNNSEKFNFSITFSRIFFAENPDILAQLNENARIQIEYNNELYELYVSSYSYNMSSDKPLPEIKVELSDTLTVTQNALQTAISEVKQDIMSSVGSIDWLQQGLRYFLRKDTNDRTRGKLSSDVGFEVGKYVSGASGAIIQVEKNTGQTVAEVDKLHVRMKAYFETLEIINVNSVGGRMILSPAGSVTCLGVEELEDAYRCYFLGEQDGEVIENRFEKYDQAYSQMFNAKVGVSNKVSNYYYWRLVTGVSENVVDYNNQKCHYIDLSKTDCDSGSDIPKAGNVICHRGSRDDTDRMNFIEFSSVGVNAPYITLFQGVNSYSLANKDYASFGYDQSTGRAYMNVYGDMYVGDREGRSYMRYSEGKLEIKGELSVGTTYDGKDLKEMIDAASPEGYQEFVEKVTQDIEGLQNQIDGAIESYFYEYPPAIDNYPAMEWDTALEKEAHLNDTFTNLSDGRSWRWTVENGVYGWTEITDTATTQALALAGKAQDTADGKRRVFVDTPTPPYDKGDLWSRGSDYPLMICVVPKSSGVYAEGDFDYADNNVKLKEEMQSLVEKTTGELNNAIGQAQTAAQEYADKGITDAQKALQASIDALNQAKANANEVYTKAEADGKISESEKAAIKAADEAAKAAIALSEIVTKAYADGIVDEEEAARIKQAEENLQAAKDYADSAAQKAFDEIRNSYLFQALTEAPETSVKNGLILSSLIQLRDKNSNIWSGINGLIDEAKGDKSIANWWGGIMDDMTDYYNWNGRDWVAKSGVSNIPANLPSGLIRMDGTGYLAKGKFWWDETGKIYADPTALFLSFNVDDPAVSFSVTILDIRDKQTEFADMWELKSDSNGNKYLMSKYNIVTQGGVTSYADTTGLNIGGIYDGLPIDGSTIYWGYDDKGNKTVLKAKVAEGGITSITKQMVIEALGFTPYDASNPNGYITSAALNGYATQSWVNSQGFLKEHQDLSGYQPLITSTNKLAYSLISGTPDLNVYALKSSLATVATSGSYNDLSNKPTIPTVPTSLKNPYALSWSGYSSGSYDGSAAKSITIPNNTNQLTNGAGFITSSALSSYLPLSGGTINGILTINRTPSAIRFNDASGNTWGWLGFNAANNAVMYQSDSSSSTVRTLIHSGNIGSQSVNYASSAGNADTLDGLHNTEFLRHIHISRLTNKDLNYANNMYGTFNYGDDATQLNTPNTTYGAYISFGDLASSDTSTTRNQTAQIAVNCWNDLGRVYVRSRQAGNRDVSNIGAWRTLAFTTDNVASATKLQTARTIWGQSFDGTGNITGTLTIPAISGGDGRYIDMNYSGYALHGAKAGWAMGMSIYLNNGTSKGQLCGAFGEASSFGYFYYGGVYNDAAMYITSNKNVGIGTSSPAYKLHIIGSSGDLIRLNSSTNYSCINYIPTEGYIWSLGASNPNIFYLYNNYVGGHVMEIDIYGNFRVNSGITSYSDIRKKTKLGDVQLTLKQIADAPLIEHYYTHDDKKTTHVGSIAQYWAGMNDWFCKQDSEGYYTMEIQNAALASAISIARELVKYESKTDRKIRQLKNKVRELELEIENLKNR